jgi:hypothetical protein
LPADNLLQNPWFQDPNDPEEPSLAGWVDETPGSGFWSLSNKPSDPTSGGFTNGAAARVSVGRGDSPKTVEIGEDAYLTQVVSADASKTTLKFFMHWVTHTVKPADVTIFGGNSPSGPWTQVWVPFNQSVSEAIKPPAGTEAATYLWKLYTASTPMVQTTLAQGYPYYKLQVHANLPDEMGGFKFTGVYFAVSGNGNPNPTVVPTQPTSNPTVTPNPTATAVPPTPGTQTFADVPATHPYFAEIEALYAGGYTSGCADQPLLYCPEQTLSRAEMAVFVERGVHGADVIPLDPGAPVFADVPLTHWAADWTAALYGDGYTTGCAVDPLRFCPEQAHSRAEAAVYMLRMRHGVDYQPPAASGDFEDVPADAWYAPWAEQAYAEGLIPDCSNRPLLYCPDDLVNRGLAAYMVVQAKGLVP